MQIDSIFGWLANAATGGLEVITSLANGTKDLFISTSEGGGTDLTFIGVLVIAGVGAPLAMKFIKYVISLFKKTQPN